MSIFTNPEKARDFLELAGVFYGTRQGHEEWNKEYPEGHSWHEDSDEETRTLNMNDTFAWALAYGREVKDEEMCEVATLFWDYGFNGLTYWCAKKDDFEDSEFHHITRGIEFVRHEEKIKEETPDRTKRAYRRVKYKIGGWTWRQFKIAVRMWIFYKNLALKRLFVGEMLK